MTDPEAATAARELYAGAPPAVHATQFPVESAEDGVRRGDSAWRNGDLNLALYLYVQALGFDAKNPTPLLRIGAIHEQRGNHQLARRAFEMALVRDPENAATSEHLGLLYLQDNERGLARSLLERAVALDPSRWRSHNGLGMVADGERNFRAAIAHYDRALELEPTAGIVYSNRGYSRALAGDLDAGEADIRGAIRLGVKEEAWRNLARVQAKRRRYPDALESFLHAFDLPKAYNALGRAAMENEDFIDARRYFELATTASPMYYEEAQKNLALANQKLLAGPGTSH